MPKYRISTGAAIVLVGFAFFCDLIGLIPIFKDGAAIFFWVIGGYYLWRHQVSPFSGKNFIAEALSLILSLIPIVQELPAEIWGPVLAIIIWSRAEDKLATPVSSDARVHNGRREPDREPPLIQGDARPPTIEGN
ncbi:MAG: hypothetical protein KGI45_03435 [Patescibacteria group bacterium]|nr:hypothetical protein [Patescibacteria group bacterium]MDE1967095.1 hypothetical protein [Patescibacteria group bacterium]